MSLTQQDITRLGSYFVSKSGGIVQGELTPDEDLTHDLGRSDHRWDTIYAGTVIADNIQSGSGVGDADTVDGFDAAGNPIASTLLALDPQGVFPITVYPTALLKDGSRALEGNLTVVADATIDGVDIGDHTHTGVGSMGLQLTHGDLLSLDADDHLQYAERAQDETITGDWMFTHLINRSAGWLFLPDDKVFKAVPHNLVLKADENEASIGIGPYESSEYAIYLFDDTTPTTYVKVGRGNDSITLHGTDATYRIWAGHVDAASAPFRVEKDGSIYATDGEIAGWTIDSTSISKNDMVLHSTGYIAAGTGDNLVRIDSQDATWRLWAGNAVAANAPFRVNKTGDLYIGSGYVSGTFRSTNFISGQSGFGLNSSGLAEFDNIIARGRLQATVFAEATIAVASGKLIISDGAVLGADMADTDDYFVVDAPVFLQNDIVRLKPDVNRDEWMRITSPYVADPDGYKYFVIRELNSGEGGYAGPYDFYAGESVVRLGSAEQVNLAFPLASGEEGGEYGEYQPGGSGSTTGGGFLILEGSRQFGPYFGVAARYGPVYDQLLDVVRIGNLDGVLDYTSEEWGAFFGDSNAFMTYDQTQGLRIEFSGTGVDTTIDDTGIATETISIAKVTAPGSSVDPFGYLYHDTSDNLLYWKYGATSYDLTAGAAGAPSSAQYVVMALSGGLSAERRLQGTALQITLTDGGAEGDATLSLPSAITLTGASSISTSSSTLSLTPVGNLILNPTALITLSKGLSTDWDAGDFEIRSNTFESDVATGTAPLVIASTTLVANLNADRVDSIEGTALAEIANTESITGPWTFGTNAPIYDIQLQIKGITAPGAGPSGYGNLFAKTDGKLYFHYFGGSEVDLTAGATTIPHILATSGPHTGELPWADMAAGTQGSIVRRGASDWEEYALGTSGYFLKAGASDVAWAAITEADISDFGNYPEYDQAESISGEWTWTVAPYFESYAYWENVNDTSDYLEINASNTGTIHTILAAFNTVTLITLSFNSTGIFSISASGGISLPELSGDWDAGAHEIRAEQFESDIATGNAPLIVASTTKVTNLNVDLLDDQSGAYYLDSANFTGTDWTDLTDAGETTLHTHPAGAPAAHVLATSGPHTGELPWADMAAGTQGSIIRRGAADWEEYALGTQNYVLKAGATDVAWGQVAFSELTGDIVYTQLDSIVDTSGGGSANLISAAAHVHTDADGSTKVTYSNLSGIPSTFTPSAHDIEGAAHTASGLTIGHVMRASGAAAFSFAALQAGDIPALDYADDTESFVVMALSGGLDNERRLQGTANQVTLTDGGAGADAVLSLPSTLIWDSTSLTLQTTTSGDIVLDPFSNLVRIGGAGVTYPYLWNNTAGSLQIGSGTTDGDYIFIATYGHFYIDFQNDATGADEIKVRDSGDAELFTIDSDGNVEVLSSLVIGTVTTAPDGVLHVFEGSAGAVTADGGADTVVIENSGDGGFSFLVPDANWSQFVFGSPSTPKSAWFSHNESLDRLDIVAPANLRFDTRISSGWMIWNDNAYDIDMRWESDDEPYFLTLDSGENKFVIGQQTPHTDMLLTMIDDDWNAENNASLLAFTQWVFGPITGTERASTSNFHSLSVASSKQAQWSMNRYITRSDIGWNRYDTAYWGSSLLQQVGSNWAQLNFFVYDGTTEYSAAIFGNQGVILNENSLAGLDIRFESDNYLGMFYQDSGEEQIHIGGGGAIWSSHDTFVISNPDLRSGVATSGSVAAAFTEWNAFSLGSGKTSSESMQFYTFEYNSVDWYGGFTLNAQYNPNTPAWEYRDNSNYAINVQMFVDDTNAQMWFEFTPKTTWTTQEWMKFDSSEIAFNDDGNNINVRMEGENEDVFLMDASVDSIIVGPKTSNAMPDTTTSRLMIFSDGSAPTYPLGTVTEGASNIFQQLSTGTSASFGAGFLARYARGTFASPTQTQSGDRLGFFLFGGRDNVGGWGNQAGFLSYTTQAYTATARGTKFQIVATSDGASSRTVIMEFQDGAILGNPSGGDLGAGILNVDVDVYLDNSKYTNPDYVLEHYWDGEIVKFANNSGALDYQGLMSIQEVKDFTKENYYLPWIDHDNPSGLGSRGDMALVGQETLMLYIFELEERIRELEKVLH